MPDYSLWQRAVRRLSLLPLIVLAVFAVVAASSPAAAKRVALVVGINQYENLDAAEQLQKAVGDSHAVGDALRSLGYDVEEADNIARLDFLRQWQHFLNRIEPGDEAAFFFAGHGVEIGGLNFLLPADVPRVASGEEEVLKASALSLNGFLEQARERKPQMALYVIDACRDNPFANAGGRGIGGTRGLTLVEPPTGTFVMFSAGAGETALDRLSDGDSDPNSVYTRTLLPRLKEPGKIGDIAREVRRDVHHLASSVNHVQTPAFYDEVIGDFCPAGCVVQAKAEATAPAKPPAPPPPDPALEAWNETRSTESIDVLGAYIAKYKDSFYAELAKARIEELKRQQQLAAAAPQRPERSGPDPALEAWNTIKDTQKASVLETFIGTYPLSFYAELARSRLKELKQKELAASVAPPPPKVLPPAPDPVLHAWDATKGTDSVATLELFVSTYPKSFYAGLAKARIEELKRKQQFADLAPARQDAPKTDPSLEAWNVAKDSESVSVLEAFVDKYPLSFYAEVAKARIAELKRKDEEAARQVLVRGIQAVLKELECYGGTIDGVWSVASRGALDRYRRVANLDPATQEPDQATLDSLKAWKGQHCIPEKVATPRNDQVTPLAREQLKGTKTPKLAKTPKASSPVKRAVKATGGNTKTVDRPSSGADYDSPAKRAEAKKAGRTLEFDYGSVYCHQGCAGGFTDVLGTTARNPGAKR
jgi:outer membrane protein assembly factor BamD (BamD/ComL family)